MQQLSNARTGCHMVHAAMAIIALNQAVQQSSIKLTQHQWHPSSMPSTYAPLTSSRHLVKSTIITTARMTSRATRFGFVCGGQPGQINHGNGMFATITHDTTTYSFRLSGHQGSSQTHSKRRRSRALYYTWLGLTRQPGLE